MYATMTSKYEASVSFAFQAGAWQSSASTLPSRLGASTDQTPKESLLTDILDIRDGLKSHMQLTADTLSRTFGGISAPMQEQLKAFQGQVEKLFDALLKDIEAMALKGDLAGLGERVGAATESYFALEISVSFEMRMVVAQQPYTPELALRAIQTVSEAMMAQEEKNQLLKVIALLDEFVRTPARDKLLERLTGVVPLLDQATGPRDALQDQLSVFRAMELYMEERENLRHYGMAQPVQAGQYSSGGYALAFSYSQQSYSYMSTSA